MADGTDMHFDAETVTHRAGFAKLRSLTKINPRLAPNLAKTLLGGQRDAAVVEAFNGHAEGAGFEFTSTWASNNIPFVAPLLRDFAARRPEGETIRYLEIGAYRCSIEFAVRMRAAGIPATENFQVIGTHSWAYWAEDLKTLWPALSPGL